jgi:Rps23 Pro-64 3,4-dihydroxylase Tpa1-like proline 4-hydroxylase
MNIENYLENGYYIGKTEELFDDINLFKKCAKELCDYSKDVNTRFKKGFLYRFEYPNVLNEKIDFSLRNFDDIKKREEYLKSNNYKTIQRWWERGLDSHGELNEHTNFFRSTTDSFIPKIYPDLDDNIAYGDSLTIYNDGDFLQRHTDGVHKERYCVILIYLSEKNDYIDGGGKLIVGNNEKDLKEVIPTNDTFVIIDFTKHDIIHEVEMVKNGFMRNTYISFIHNEEKWFMNELKNNNVDFNKLQQFNERAAKKLFPEKYNL